jgi:hypothetical protein
MAWPIVTDAEPVMAEPDCTEQALIEASEVTKRQELAESRWDAWRAAKGDARSAYILCLEYPSSCMKI